MKKYLMTGVAALAFAATFTSCSKTDLYDENKINEQKEANLNQKYAEAFEAAFGKVGANVDWGFSSTAKTRTAYTNSNMWVQDGYNVPAEITPREKEVVMGWFRTHENPQSETVDIHNYFIQNVGYTDHTYNAYYQKDGRTETVTITNPGTNQMDYIFVGPGYYLNDWEGMTEPARITNNDGDDHVNNFNANSGEIQYMKYSGSEYFGFHDSYGTGYSTAGHSTGKYCQKNRNFVIRFIDVDGVVGCYVGFNYESGKTTEGWHLDPDGFFDDRVIKLVPGDGFNTPDPLKRVIAEDLTASQAGDFDFNDVVFDVVKYEGGKTTLRLQACGGTLPLKIGSTNGVGGIDVHGLFGDTTPDANGKLKMWNTGAGNSHAPVDFDIDGEFTTPAQLLALRIEVEKEGQWVLLTAERGKAACKILVDDRFPIVPERHSIANENGNFTTYVQGNWPDENEKFWWVQE
jgi:hypothetical protein